MSFRNVMHRPWIAAGLLTAVVASASLSQWSQRLEATSAAYAAIFKSVPMPGGAVTVRRAPAESRPALTSLMNGAASSPELWALRAREDEVALDFAAAERDWTQYAAKATSTVAGLTALADYYERRNQLAQAVDTLVKAIVIPAEKRERLVRPEKQAAWALWQRAERLSQEGLLGSATDQRVLEAALQRFPEQAAVHKKLFDFLIARGDGPGAGAALDRYRKQFPDDTIYPVEAAAAVEAQAGRLDAALEIYEKAFQPTWPNELADSWLNLLAERQPLRAFREQVRARIAADPTDFRAAAELFHIWNHAHEPVSAALSLERWRQGVEASGKAFDPRQLLDGADLLSRVNRFEDAARFLQTAYVLSTSDKQVAATALARLTELLLDHPEHPIALGQANFDFYRDVATMDRGPGFLNGILSLVLNGEPLRARLTEQEQGATSYWHRSAAARLLDEMATKYPAAPQREALEAKLVEAYNVYGASEGVVTRSTKFLTAYPQSKYRRQVSLALADAYARLNRVTEELAVYERVLGELSRAADGVPVGDESMWPAGDAAPKARSTEYVEVLDRYIARLVSLRRTNDALIAYRRELDRNPDDPGLYLRLAEFLQQNRRTTEAEQIYQKARQQFNDTSWTDRLARWYLTTKQTAKVRALTSEVLRAFSGSDLEQYLEQVVTSSELGAQYALQVNLAALQRFPRNVSIIKRVVLAYGTKPTANPIERLKLLRESWTLDEELKNAYFQELSAQKRLDGELSAARQLLTGDAGKDAVGNPAAVAMVAGVEVWRSHFEEASPWMVSLASARPGDQEQVLTTASLLRSLAWFDARKTTEAVAWLRRLAEAEPANATLWTTIGETLADREQFTDAATAWRQISASRPGDADRYVEAATVFWDYFQFSEARAQLSAGRGKLKQPALFGYEYGAILETESRPAEAIQQYVLGATAGVASGGDGEDVPGLATSRLVALAKRPATKDLVDQATREWRNEAGLRLRLRVLEATDRRREAEQELSASVNRSNDGSVLSFAEAHATEAGYPAAAEAVVVKRVALATDPVERTRLRIEQAKFYEARNESAKAQEILAEAWREQPKVLGVMRALTDFYWRQQQTGRALDVLDQAASRAYPELRQSLLSELASKAQERGEYGRVRQALDPLLKSDPLRVEWVQLYGDSLRQEGRSAEWQRYMQASIDAARKAGTDTSALRRAYSYGLRAAGDMQASLDQRIEVLNEYLDDRGLLDEMARDAIRGQREKQLLDYYAKAVAGSPRNARLWVALARFQVWFEQLSPAAASYAQALAIRPEEQAVHEERADALTRQLRFDEAAAEYRKLFELTYGNADWALKQAEMLSRAGKTKEADAVAEVVASRDNTSRRLSSLAAMFERWNQLNVAEKYGVRAVERIKWESDASEARPYVRLMSRQRRLWEGLDRIGRATTDPAAYSMLAQEAGRTVGEFFTPEEKVTLAGQIDARMKASSSEQGSALIELAASARMNDELAKLLADAGMSAADGAGGDAALGRLRGLQFSRLQYSDFGGVLERRAAREQGDRRVQFLNQAADVYQQAGNVTAEARVRSQLPVTARSLAVTYLRSPDQLTRMNRPDAINLLIEEADASRTLIAFDQWSKTQDAKKATAWRALIGLHLRLLDRDTRASFERLLGSSMIGDRLAKTAADTVKGTAWYPLANEYAHWLKLANDPESAELSMVSAEQGPVTSGGLASVAEDWSEEERAVAIRAYQGSLELNASEWRHWRDVAVLHVKAGDSGAAASDWKQAFASVKDLAGFVSVVAAGGGTGAPEAADQALQRLQQGGGLTSGEGLVDAATQAPAWFDRLVALDALEVWQWEDLARDGRLTSLQRRSVYQRLLQSREAAVARANGSAREEANESLRQLREQYVDWLLSQGDVRAAEPILALLTQHDSVRYAGQQALVAGLRDSVAALLTRWNQASEAGSTEAILATARTLRQRQKPDQALLLEEYVYQREWGANASDPTWALGLAEVRLRQNRPAEAERLLQTVVVRMGQPFTFHEAAATLLDRYQRPTAQELWRQLAVAGPWNANAALHVAKDAAAVKQLASSADLRYAERVAAAERLSRMGGESGLGSAELEGLASVAVPTPDQADRPYYLPLRLRVASAAGLATDQRIRLLGSALAVNPDERSIRVALITAASSTRARLAYLALRAINVSDYELFTPASEEPGLYATAAQVTERLGMLSEADTWWKLVAKASTDPSQQRQAQAGLQRVAERQRFMSQVERTKVRVGLAYEEQPNVRARPMEATR